MRSPHPNMPQTHPNTPHTQPNTRPRHSQPRPRDIQIRPRHTHTHSHECINVCAIATSGRHNCFSKNSLLKYVSSKFLLAIAVCCFFFLQSLEGTRVKLRVRRSPKANYRRTCSCSLRRIFQRLWFRLYWKARPMRNQTLSRSWTQAKSLITCANLTHTDGPIGRPIEPPFPF